MDNLRLEYVETFYLAPALTDLWTDDLLGWPLAPGEIANVGDFEEDWYDAEADLEFGDCVDVVRRLRAVRRGHRLRGVVSRAGREPRILGPRGHRPSGVPDIGVS